MDTLARLILVTLTWFFAGSVLAAGSVSTSTTTGTTYRVTVASGSYYSTMAAACAYFNSTQTPASCGAGCTTSFQHRDLGGGVYACQRRLSTGAWDSLQYGYNTSTGPITSCPSNSTDAGGGNCTCNANYVPNLAGTACVAAAVECPDRTFGITALQVPSVGLGACYENCAVRGTSSYSTGGTVWVYGPWTMDTPGDCSTTAASEIPPADVCPVGQVRATVGGSSVCVPATTSVTGSSTAASAPAGAASAPTSSVTDKAGTSNSVPPGGSSTSQTTCTGNACSTTTNIYNASGVKIGTTTTTSTKGGFCEENPDTSICADSSFSGMCSTAFVCDGDAIQCAIAKEQHQRNCTLYEGTNSAVTAAEVAASAGRLPSTHPGNPANVATTDLSGGFTQTELLGAASCPTPPTFTWQGQSFTMDYDKLCDWAPILGQMLVAACAVACAFIAFRRD